MPPCCHLLYHIVQLHVITVPSIVAVLLLLPLELKKINLNDPLYLSQVRIVTCEKETCWTSGQKNFIKVLFDFWMKQ